MGTAFPLFSQQMYDKLTFKWASTLFGCIAVLMAPIPFIVRCFDAMCRITVLIMISHHQLFFWGPQIRARSKFAKRMMHIQWSKTIFLNLPLNYRKYWLTIDRVCCIIQKQHDPLDYCIFLIHTSELKALFIYSLFSLRSTRSYTCWIISVEINCFEIFFKILKICIINKHTDVHYRGKWSKF